MFVNVPPLDTLSAESLVGGFSRLLESGFDNPHRARGLVRVFVPDNEPLSFTAAFGDTLDIRHGDLSTPADTTITMPTETIRRVFVEFEHLDWRDPSIVGTMEFSGDLGLASHLAKSCLRPPAATVRRFEQVAALHAANGHRNIAEITYLERPT